MGGEGVIRSSDEAKLSYWTDCHSVRCYVAVRAPPSIQDPIVPRTEYHAPNTAVNLSCSAKATPQPT